MLDSSKARLADASAEDKRAAEVLAASWMATQLEEDLISAEQARATVAEHREQGTEDWMRAVYSALVGLRALKTEGATSLG